MRLLRPAPKTFAGPSVLAVLALTVTGCSGGGDGATVSADGRTRVDFGYISDYNGASLLAIADEQGLWEKQKLAPSYKTFTNGPLQIQALGAGDLDFGYIGPGAVWLPASGKAKIVAINTLTYADRVVARPGIDSVADLKGKKVGVPEGTSGEMVLNLALEEAGLSEKDIEKVPMDPATVVSALASGQVDAAGFWYPAIGKVKEQQPDLKELASTRDFDGRAFPTAFVSGPDADRELTEKVVAVLQEANDWRAAHPEEAVTAAAKLLKVDEADVKADAANVETLTTDELVKGTEDGTVAGWLDGLTEFFAGTGQLKDAPGADSYYQGDVYTEVGSR